LCKTLDAQAHQSFPYIVPAILELRDVSKNYRVDQCDIPALDHIDLEVISGEVFGIIGHSGAGKSTLIRLINLLEHPTKGAILIDGQDITRLDKNELRVLRRKIGMIFQHFNLLSSKTVAQNIAFPLRIAGHYNEDEIKKRVGELIDRVGLIEHTDKYPAQLSGGQKQRVGIARALATQPRILLCDEATSALDPQTTQSVLNLLNEINIDLKLTIVLITHEMNVIRMLCDRVAVLDQGKIVELGEVSNVFLHPQHPTSRRFVYESEDIDEEMLHAAFSHLESRLIRLTFRGNRTYEPILGNIMRAYHVDFSILSGRIDRIKNMPYGQLILGLQGDSVDDALAHFRQQGLTVEELR
jgi:D-methionine transport system ATP-binding protein